MVVAVEGIEVPGFVVGLVDFVIAFEVEERDFSRWVFSGMELGYSGFFLLFAVYQDEGEIFLSDGTEVVEIGCDIELVVFVGGS
jgi:hypothetical protein